MPCYPLNITICPWLTFRDLDFGMFAIMPRKDEGNNKFLVSNEGNKKVKGTELDSGWRWGWWKKNGCKMAWSPRHKTPGFTEMFFRHLKYSVQNQINLILLRSPCYFRLKRLSVSLTKLWDDANTEDWMWFHTQTERVAKMYCKLRNGGQRTMHITWSISVKMSSDKENKDSHYMEQSAKVIRGMDSVSQAKSLWSLTSYFGQRYNFGQIP